MEKARQAAALLNEPDLALSVQVLQEFYVQATRPTAASPLGHETAVAFIETMMRFRVQEITLYLVQSALAAKSRWRLSYWDTAIVEAARAFGCDVLCTEDLVRGRDFGGVRIVNPFV